MSTYLERRETDRCRRPPFFRIPARGTQSGAVPSWKWSRVGSSRVNSHVRGSASGQLSGPWQTD